MKKNVGTIQGDVYPAAEQQMLMHQGEVLKDTTALEDNNAAKTSIVSIMFTQGKIKSIVNL